MGIVYFGVGVKPRIFRRNVSCSHSRAFLRIHHAQRLPDLFRDGRHRFIPSRKARIYKPGDPPVTMSKGWRRRSHPHTQRQLLSYTAFTSSVIEYELMK